MDVFQAYAATAGWYAVGGFTFAVVKAEVQFFMIGVQMEFYAKNPIRTNSSVFEAVFSKRQKQQGRDGHAVVLYGNIRLHLEFIAVAQLFQSQVILQQLDFFGQRHRVHAGAVHQIVQQFGEFEDTVGSKFGFGQGQTVNVVQRVEQKMRMQLPFEQFDFRLGFGLDEFFVQFLFAAVIPNDVDAHR